MSSSEPYKTALDAVLDAACAQEKQTNEKIEIIAAKFI
jgi:hypothetical protein